MTTTTTESVTRPHADRALRATAALALVSGGALVIDTVTIAVLNRHFDPLDSILFLAGFAGLWLTAIALAVHLSARRRGRARLALSAAVFIATAVVLGAVAAVFDQLGRHVFAKTNIGLHGEWSFFSIGVCLLVVAAWAVRRQRETATPAR
ncbi:hypothetical protein [uncultured Jatrophihabitans sp.]|uniref:hypothetical protein n=1 Tax=uncultured Jatrophihabitans sp. TaxID=1610747 RepID=UPI0035CB892E